MTARGGVIARNRLDQTDGIAVCFKYKMRAELRKFLCAYAQVPHAL